MSVPAAPCRVANVLRYEWNVIFLVIPAERIHSFMGTWVQHLFRPLNTKPFFSGEYSISFRASSLMGMMSSVFVFCVMVCTHFPPAAKSTISSQQRVSMSLSLKLVRHEKREAVFRTGFLHGVSARQYSSSTLRYSLATSSGSIFPESH